MDCFTFRFYLGFGLNINSYFILFIAASNGHKDVAKVLLFHGAEVDIEDKEGESPLHRGGFNKIQINKYSKRIY